MRDWKFRRSVRHSLHKNVCTAQGEVYTLSLLLFDRRFHMQSILGSQRLSRRLNNSGNRHSISLAAQRERKNRCHVV